MDVFLLVQDNLPSHLFARTPLQIRREPIDHWYFVLQRSGTTEVAFADRVVSSTPGKLAFRSLARPFEGTKSNSDTLVLFLPRDHFWQMAPAFDMANNTILDAPLGLLLSDYLQALERQIPLFASTEVPRIASVTRTMIAACMAPSQDRLAQAAAPIAATLFERARRYIDENLQSPSLTPEKLCRSLGVSRRVLYNVFERYGGVVHYIRRRRLVSCHAAIVDPLEIATHPDNRL